VIIKNDVEAMASQLRESERLVKAGTPLRENICFLHAESSAAAASLAYAVQNFNTKARVASGDRIVGRKVGLTSLAVQRQLGVEQPDFGTLFASMASGDSDPISLSALIQPKVESEIAFVLENDLLQEKHTYADLIRGIAFAVTAIEVVDSRIESWNIHFVDTVSDNASSARFVLGSRPVQLHNVDLGACKMTMSKDSEVLSRGVGSSCLGNPLNAAVWLADQMVQLGTPLRAGDVLMSGALGPMVAVVQPGVFTADIEGFGSVRANFSA
jgi:2-keto-4-pentenoate hydratase